MRPGFRLRIEEATLNAAASGPSITGFDSTPRPVDFHIADVAGPHVQLAGDDHLADRLFRASPGRSGKAPGEPVTITSPGCKV